MIDRGPPFCITAIVFGFAFNIIAEAENGLRVLEILKVKPVDVILLDINMPEMDGIECAKEISKNGYNTKIIILTQYHERWFIKKLKDYICGYLLKDTGKEELVQAVRKVYNGEKYFHDSLKLNNENTTTYYDSYLKSLEISGREKEVLLLICKEKTTVEIATTLNINHSTVETYRERLLIKTGAKNMAGLVMWAVENNFL